MNFVFRSRLFRTAMLAFAVLFSQTANAAKPARALSSGTPPASVKLCAAWPESKNDFSASIKKVQRPNPGPAAYFFHSAAVFLPAGAGNLQASQKAADAVQVQRAALVAPQFRAFALRI